MEVELRVLVGSAVGQKINVAGPKFYVGRAEDCQLRPRSDLISRHHCAIIVEEDYVALRDFGSKNGTYVNDERVSGEREMHNGDKLVIGPLEFEVCVERISLGSKKRSKVTSVKEAVARSAGIGAGPSSETAADSEMDISEWIGDGEQDPKGDTREMAPNSGDTREFRLDATAPQPDDVEAKSHANDEDDDGQSGKRSKKKEPGKLPKSADSAESSDEAAAAMLKRLRRFR